jgi:hypothetical protein
MRPNNLSAKGLSITQAQSISNLIYQASRLIQDELSKINNSSKTLTINGSLYVKQQAFPIPNDIVDKLTYKAQLHAAQAFLMENLKAKANLIETLRNEKFITELKAPETPKYQHAEIEPMIGEEWAYEKLTASEINEWLYEETIAAHIGMFIHDNSKLDSLRKSLPNEQKLEFHSLTSNGTITEIPITITVHHTAEGLFKLHQELSDKHRESEKRVNYYRAKIQNLVSDENVRRVKDNKDKEAEVDRINSGLRAAYNTELATYEQALADEKKKFNANQLQKINEASKLRIQVDTRFKDVIDKFAAMMPDTEADGR